MRRVVVGVLLLGAGCPTLAADGQAGGYFAVSYGQAEYRAAGAVEMNPLVASVTLGQQLTPTFAFEGRVGRGVSDDQITLSGVRTNLELDNYFGAYMRGGAPLSEHMAVYAVAGYTRALVRARSAGTAWSDTAGDISWGAGFDLRLGDGMSLNLEWMRLVADSQYDLNLLALGLRVGF